MGWVVRWSDGDFGEGETEFDTREEAQAFVDEIGSRVDHYELEGPEGDEVAEDDEDDEHLCDQCGNVCDPSVIENLTYGGAALCEDCGSAWFE